MRRMRCLWILVWLLFLGLANCGGEDGSRGHDADGHTHDGAPHEHDDGHGHDHDHDSGVPPEAVPIVRYEPDSDQGPHGGVVARLSSLDDPDHGWVEVLIPGRDGRAELWLARDRAFAQPHALPAGATVRLELVEHERELLLGAAERGKPCARFVLEAGPDGKAAWLAELGERELARVRIQVGKEVLVSDDFELRGHAATSGK